MERREAEKTGSGWDVWWEGERRLWVGPVSTQANGGSQNSGRRPEPECPHGPPKPLTTFFPHLPPPNPVDLPFHTTFCPGVGREWFVGGLSVMGSSISSLAGFSSSLSISPTSTPTPSSSSSSSERKQLEGWTDIDKQTSLGDMVWPKPLPTWVGFGADEEIVDGTASLPNVESEICFDDAWLGGSSLRLRITSTEVLEEESFRCFQIPINSLSLSPHVSYVAHLTYKVLSPARSSEAGTVADLDLDVGISIKVLEQVGVFREVTMLDLEESLIEGALNTSSWSRASIKFSVPADYTGDFVTSIGVQLGFMTPEPSTSSSGPGYAIDMLIGQICVYQAPPQSLSPPDPRILYVEYDPTKETLQWGVGSSLIPPAPINLSTILPDDPNPVWILDTSRRWLPSFLYYNLYYQLPNADGSYEDPTLAKFYASTQMEDEERFRIDRGALEGLEGQKRRVRFYVQGVTDRGTLLELGKCCSLDVTF
jgi:mannosyl-glycoprotein endo-beta-N-acetylglucosaminidase